MMGKFQQQVDQHFAAARQVQELIDQKLRGDLEGPPGVVGQPVGFNFAHSRERKGGMFLEMFPDGLQRVAEGGGPLIPADLNLANGNPRPSHDQGGLAGLDEVLSEAFREPERDFCGAHAGVTVGEFEKKNVDDAADDIDGLCGCGEIDLVLPALDERAGTDESGLTIGHAWIEDDMDVPMPGVGQLQGAQEGALNGFARDDESVGCQFNEIGAAGSEAAGGWGGGKAAVRSDDELAGTAAGNLEFRISEQLAQVGGVRNGRESAGCDDAGQ
jgi:hypothetical protein